MPEKKKLGKDTMGVFKDMDPRKEFQGPLSGSL